MIQTFNFLVLSITTIFNWLDHFMITDTISFLDFGLAAIAIDLVVQFSIKKILLTTDEEGNLTGYKSIRLFRRFK